MIAIMVAIVVIMSRVFSSIYVSFYDLLSAKLIVILHLAKTFSEKNRQNPCTFQSYYGALRIGGFLYPEGIPKTSRRHRGCVKLSDRERAVVKGLE